MLKSINLGQYFLRPEDYGVVVRFFRSIGCDLYINAKRFARFGAPTGVLMVHETRPGQSERANAAPMRVIIGVESPHVVRNIAESMQLKIVRQNEDVQYFEVELPGQITVGVQGVQEEQPPEIHGDLRGIGKKFSIVVSRFNSFITERLLQGTLDGLLRCGAKREELVVVRVPGAFEIPLAARKLAQTKKYDAIICLGCLLRGDTAHYDVIVNEVTRGIGQSAQETGVPHAFGVLTCENLEQAIDRAGLKMGNKGFEAALAAVEMASLTVGIRPASGVRKAASKKQVPRFARNDKSNRNDKSKNRNDKPTKIQTARRRN